MIKAVTSTQMRQIETTFMKKTGCPSILLMEHAALALVRAIGTDKKRVLFICGFGNNGGDGLAAARLYRGPCDVWVLYPDKLHGDALLNLSLLKTTRPDMVITPIEGHLPSIPRDTDIIVDAIFGTGMDQPASTEMANLFIRINQSGLPVLACDIPSGIHGTTGDILGSAVIAEKTITFHRPKTGLYLKNAVDYTGDVIIADIGIPDSFDPADLVDIAVLNDYKAYRPLRRKNSHKGLYGHVLVIAGSEGMAGAAAICAKAAIKAGAGLVTLLCDEGVLSVVQTIVPGAMGIKLPKDYAFYSTVTGNACEIADIVAIGPGLGHDESRIPIIEAVIASGKPVVWDADALNLLALYDHLRTKRDHYIFTPHPGEAKRFIHEPPDDSIAFAAALQDMLGGTVLLKGATSIIKDLSHTAFNISGTPAMAKGGSGDALTGIIAALYAQDINCPYLAAQMGAFIHGEAGKKAAEHTGDHALDIMTLIDFIGG